MKVDSEWKLVGSALLLLLTTLGCDARAAQRQEVALGDDVLLVMETSPFNPADHDIVLCEGVPCLIDGAPVYGAYESVPTLEIRTMALEIGERTITLEHRGMFNPWSPREDRPIDVWLEEEPGGRLVIRGRFSDGAAAYVAEWTVIEGGSIRTILKCLECLALSYNSFISGD